MQIFRCLEVYPRSLVEILDHDAMQMLSYIEYVLGIVWLDVEEVMAGLNTIGILIAGHQNFIVRKQKPIKWSFSESGEAARKNLSKWIAFRYLCFPNAKKFFFKFQYSAWTRPEHRQSVWYSFTLHFNADTSKYEAFKSFFCAAKFKSNCELFRRL